MHMEEINHIEVDDDKIDETMLPGFRFHPTDEELVGFYLKRKIQQRPLSIELIKQLDIYKYDPWDLPSLAATGEKEWYFYCPRDRKYRNSARPNRVTAAGFWKATGTDRPIYSPPEQGSKCIGLKKSLVFYRGRAAKGIKTDWMMHEFRLPSVSDTVKKHLDKHIPANEAWAICRIFKKANSSSAQRAASHSWISPTTNISDAIDSRVINNVHFSSNNITTASSNSPPDRFGSYNNVIEYSSITGSFSPMQYFSSAPIYQMEHKPRQVSCSDVQDRLTYATRSSDAASSKSLANNDASSYLLVDMSSSILGDFGKGSSENHHVDFITSQEQCDDGFRASFAEDVQGNIILGHGDEGNVLVKSQNVGQMGFSQTSSSNVFGLTEYALLKSNLTWDSPPCPSELSCNFY